MLWSGMPLGNRGIFNQCPKRKWTPESHGPGVYSLYKLWAIDGCGINQLFVLQHATSLWSRYQTRANKQLNSSLKHIWEEH